MTWNQALTEWNDFLDRVSDVRSSLHCSSSNAWFRGHSNSLKYELLPTLYRVPNRPDPDTKGDRDAVLRKLNAFPDEIRALKKNAIVLKKNLYRARTKGDSVAEQTLSSDLRNAQRAISRLKAEQRENKAKLKRLNLVYTGESEAFIGYSFRSGATHHSSWETLAEMQHYGVRTRLLDWSENLAVALYFSLSKYFRSLEDFWAQHDGEMPFHDPGIKHIPSIWILNPYSASKSATGRLRIWDLTLDPSLDYFESFVASKSWPFDRPVAMYSPWKNPRLAAQQGMFTVFGHDRSPLDKQLSAKVVHEVQLSSLAAIYAVKHLKTFLGMDHFTLFRDLETLAAKVNAEFLGR